jgi:hypothetical protein
MPANLPLFPTLPRYAMGAGIRTSFGTILPTGTRVSYVRSTGVQTGDPEDIAGRILPTLDAGLKECRSGVGDIVYILPGHTETVTSTSLANLVAGTRIMGIGDLNRDDAPTFTWSTAAATWAISVKNVYISGLRLLCDNFNGVTNAINITAAGCTLEGNLIRIAQSASLLATSVCTIGSGALDTYIVNNRVSGNVLGLVTDCFKLLGATTPDRTVIANNTMIAAANVNNGLVNVSVAAVDLHISGNIIYNTGASSVACIAVANVASDGVVSYNMMGCKSAAGAPAAQGIVFTSTGSLIVCFENRCVTAKETTGIVSPVNDA